MQCSRENNVRVEVDVEVEVRTGELLARGALGVQVERAEAEAGAELEQRAQVERGHVRLRPALAALLHVLLELYPPARTRTLTLSNSSSS